jgi:phosphoribosylformylglycinamidine (FGAM) synthase-like amidotransferase family enzyme
MSDELDRRITASAFLRPVVADAIKDEATTSLECVRVCNGVMCLIEDHIAHEREIITEINSIISAIRERLSKETA